MCRRRRRRRRHAHEKGPMRKNGERATKGGGIQEPTVNIGHDREGKEQRGHDRQQPEHHERHGFPMRG